MNSNSNFNITKVTVDPTSQEITGLEVNGKAFESGGSSDEYETWYAGAAYLYGRSIPLAINGNPYDANPNITHYVIPYNPDDEGDEMNWEKFEAYDVEVYEDSCGGMGVAFYADEEKTNHIVMYTNEQEGAMSKIYIKSSDITNA